MEAIRRLTILLFASLFLAGGLAACDDNGDEVEDATQ